MTITFLFPDRGGKPCGGNKVVYEYANRLTEDGHTVHIVYAGALFFSQKSFRFKLSAIYRYLYWFFKGFSGRKWFNLSALVEEHWTFSLNERHVPKSDIYICTTPYSAMYLKDYKVGNDCKYYFIQGYEKWGRMTDEILRKTYHYSLQKIVVSQWLKEVLDEESLCCSVVPNGFDFSIFIRTLASESRSKYSISMVYSPIAVKGCEYGIEAISIARKKYPQLQATFFGTSSRPEDLPAWIEYYQSPTIEKHIQINNEAAIFVGSSIQEGWGLPVGEAMACSQAVVCTDNLGYLEIAIDGENALVSPIRDAQKMAENIIRLIEDDNLRYRIAHQGYEHIQQFSIEDSYRKFKEAIKA